MESVLHTGRPHMARLGHWVAPEVSIQKQGCKFQPLTVVEQDARAFNDSTRVLGTELSLNLRNATAQIAHP